MRITYNLKKLSLVLVLLLLNGCGMVSYYNQSIQGQLSILYNREDIDSIINDTETDEALKEKLKQVKTIRQYASDALLLPRNKSYLYYTDLHRPYVVWNVFAAPEFSLEPITWCYPIVGCVSYRGYFAENNAAEHSRQLSSEGNDSHVAGIAAYSTLGWFNDPLLNTMTHWPERSLAGLIFHELTHQVIYISNETGFNEAFASAVERIGSIQWLIEKNPAQLPHYLNYLNAQNDFRNLLSETRSTLNTLYLSDNTNEEKRRGKALIIQKMQNEYTTLKQQWPDTIHFDSWFKKPVNNARFTSSMTYLRQIPAFYTLYLEANGDWELFYNNVKQMESLEREERNKLINSKLDNNFDLNQIVTLIKAKQSNI
ncbi:MAG: aminopeptidase [Gammaproteobacteria bacterium]|nr:aminopeptidase [Gammaproteobacteria bacterium]